MGSLLFQLAREARETLSSSNLINRGYLKKKSMFYLSLWMNVPISSVTGTWAFCRNITFQRGWRRTHWYILCVGMWVFKGTLGETTALKGLEKAFLLWDLQEKQPFAIFPWWFKAWRAEPTLENLNFESHVGWWQKWHSHFQHFNSKFIMMPYIVAFLVLQVYIDLKT